MEWKFEYKQIVINYSTWKMFIKMICEHGHGLTTVQTAKHQSKS